MAIYRDPTNMAAFHVHEASGGHDLAAWSSVTFAEPTGSACVTIVSNSGPSYQEKVVVEAGLVTLNTGGGVSISAVGKECKETCKGRGRGRDGGMADEGDEPMLGGGGNHGDGGGVVRTEKAFPGTLKRGMPACFDLDTRGKGPRISIEELD